MYLRLFYALWPDEPLRERLAEAARDAVRQSGGRPVPAGNYHLTLAFLGRNTGRRLVDLVSALLDDLPSPETSRLGIDGVGGAYERAGQLALIRDEGLPELQTDPRVLWLAAACE